MKKAYPGKRTIEEFESFFLVLPESVPDIAPLSCGVCEQIFRTHDDISAWHKFKCCDFCANTWHTQEQQSGTMDGALKKAK